MSVFILQRGHDGGGVIGPSRADVFYGQCVGYPHVPLVPNQAEDAKPDKAVFFRTLFRPVSGAAAAAFKTAFLLAT